MQLSKAQIQSFKENGYLIIPNVLSADQIQFLRKRIMAIFETGEWKKSPYNTEKVLSDVYNTFPEFIDITLNETVIEAIRSLTDGTPVLIPETSIHYKIYTGWHKDTSSQEKAGKSFHWKENALMLECGFYMQDNDPVLGGGLTVMQGSHNTKDNLIDESSYELSFMDKVKIKLGIYREDNNSKLNPNKHKVVDVPSKAGDFVIFNFRTNHRATTPKGIKITEVPVERSKLAFFNAFSVDNETVTEYLDFIKSRKDPYYQSLKTQQPSPHLIETAKKLNFKLA